MGLRWHTLVVECRDVDGLATWWQAALGWCRVPVDGDAVVIAAPDVVHQLDSLSPDERGPGLCFVQAVDDKQVKNRLHVDLAPRQGTTQRSEVDRLLALGARSLDIGQGAVAWQVLADPEGNEFYVLPDGTQ